eukprot:Unigene12278_Nuclearia_a/m.37309 Unigene12278_Nuclearia_a/g.37309  ORF Unigene12278_Nuclearia_a/g.37309 Unigene12278_Nuclearia_a/m.37309 type:complete len:392 (+) Unigene12278_Nuclearia_a:194-1369(+)
MLLSHDASASANGTTSNHTGGSWPYPGDGYNVTLWHAYDVTMAVLYLLLFVTAMANVVSVVRTAQPQAHMAGTRSRLRLAFYVFTAIQTLLRATFFSCAYNWRTVPQGVGDVRMKTMASLIVVADLAYFSMYTILLTFWAVVDITSRGQHRWRAFVQRVAIAINVVLYCVVLGAGVLVSIDLSYRKKLVTAITISIATFSFIVALSFLVFGLRLYYKFRTLASDNDAMLRLLWQITFMSASCVFCFTYRGVYIATLTTRQFGTLSLATSYFVLGEIIPIVLMLLAFIYFPSRSMRWLTPRRSGEQAPLKTAALHDDDNDDRASIFSYDETATPHTGTPASRDAPTTPRTPYTRSGSGSGSPGMSRASSGPSLPRNDYGALNQPGPDTPVHV